MRTEKEVRTSDGRRLSGSSSAECQEPGFKNRPSDQKHLCDHAMPGNTHAALCGGPMCESSLASTFKLIMTSTMTTYTAYVGLPSSTELVMRDLA